jgi:hypothetical protein
MSEKRFIPIFKAFSASTRPLTEYAGARSEVQLALLRDNFTLLTWLSIGASIQVFLSLILGPYRALWLPVVYVFFKLSITYLQILGVIAAPNMAKVVNTKTAAVLPNADGTYGPTPANAPINVFMVGARTNHPAGLLSPGLKKMGDYFTKMLDQLSEPEYKKKYGVIGVTLWVGASRMSNNGPMAVIYFTSEDGVHRFAHDPLHAEAWRWLASHAKQYPHLGFWHESFTAGKGQWEGIYVHDEPMGLAAGSMPIKVEGQDEELWAPTLVDSRKGILRSSRGRQGDASGNGENVPMEERVYG